MDGGRNDRKSEEVVGSRDALRRWSRTSPAVRIPRNRPDERGTDFWRNLYYWERGASGRVLKCGAVTRASRKERVE